METAEILVALLVCALGAFILVRHLALLKTQAALRESVQFNQAIISNAGEGIVVYDRELNYVVWNRFMEEMTGMPASEVIGRNALELFPHIREQGLEPLLRLAVAGKDVASADIRYYIPTTGRTGWTSSVYRPYRNASGEIIGVISLIRDITSRRRAEEQVEYQALHDVLTDLGNRNLFHDHLALALAVAQRRNRIVAVFFLDLDHFKLINDSHGHNFGDNLLKAVAKRLRGCVRKADTVARIGGDEFAIILQDMERHEDAADLARKIVSVVAEPLELDGQRLHVTTSIGVSLYPHDGTDPDMLLKNADNAMYRAKAEGRNTYQLCTPEMRRWVEDRLILENGLHRALQNGEFLLHYQPEVDLETLRVNGMEALLRWNDPERGLLAPGSFIPLAEERGLIVPIGEWVLKESCKQARKFQEMGFPHFRVSVNLSARQFRDPNLMTAINSALEESGLDPQCLELEITESVAMSDVEQSLRILNALRLRGISIAIDDFGTGHSSLSYLKRFTLDALKIDRMFINDLASAEGDKAIVASIIRLAHGLRLRVIAEGVEKEEQLGFLRDNGCESVQGFLFSYPLSATDFERLLAKGQPVQPLPDFSRRTLSSRA
jgi:diguanylate cyclase (GGDEF)-like protein/PAS domain S-box-containing protein